MRSRTSIKKLPAVYLTVWAGVASLLVPLVAQDTSSPDPSDIWLQGFMIMKDGQEFEETGEHLQAVSKYREALKLFDYVARRHPNWKSNMMDYRRRNLLDKIGELQEQMKGGSPSDEPLPQPEPNVADDSRGMKPNETIRFPSGETQNGMTVMPVPPHAAPPAVPYSPSSTPQDFLTQKQQQIDMLTGENLRLKSERQSREQQIQSLQGQLNQARAEQEKIRAQLEQALKDLADARSMDEKKALEAQLAQATEQLKAANKKSAEILAALEEARVEIAQLKKDREALLADRQSRLEQFGKLEQDLEKIAEERDRARQQLAQNAANNNVPAEMKGALAEVAKQRDDLQKRLEAELQKSGELTEKNKELVDELKKSRQTIDMLNETVASLTTERDDLKKEREDLSRRLDLVTRERDEIKKERDEMAILLNANEEIDGDIKDMLSANEKWREELTVARRQVAELTAREGDYKAEIAALREQVEAIRTERVKLEKENANYQERITDLGNKLKDVLAELDDTKAELADAMKSGGGEALAKARAENAELREEVVLLTRSKEENDLLKGIIRRQLVKQARLQEARDLVLEELRKLDVQSNTLLENLDGISGERLVLTQDELEMFKSPEDVKLLDALEKGEAIEVTDTAPGTVSSGPAGKMPVQEQIAKLAKAANYDFSEGNYKAAADGYRQVLEADRMNVVALCNLGVIYIRQGNLEEARAQFERALAQDPECSSAYYYMGVLNFKNGDMDAALESFGESIRHGDTNANAHNYIGLIASEKGWGTRAENEFRKAVEIDPEHANAHFNLSVFYATRNKPEKDLAEQFYMKALSLGADRDSAIEHFING